MNLFAIHTSKLKLHVEFLTKLQQKERPKSTGWELVCETLLALLILSLVNVYFTFSLDFACTLSGKTIMFSSNILFKREKNFAFYFSLRILHPYYYFCCFLSLQICISLVYIYVKAVLLLQEGRRRGKVALQKM